MSDALSAASLLMAVVAILYGAWYQEINQATALTVPTHDRHAPLGVVEAALFARCLPLAGMAVMVVLVFLPMLVEIVWHALGVARARGLGGYVLYDSVRMAFCLVVVVGAGIAGHLCRMTWVLVRLRGRLKG
ncbi:hypothetical protein [gamma proteobacterium L18]